MTISLHALQHTIRAGGIAVTSVAVSPDGTCLAAGCADASVLLFQLQHDTLTNSVSLRGHFQGVQAVAWSPDGLRLASASLDQTVRVWDVAQATYLYTFHGRCRPLSTVAWSPDGQRLASGGADMNLHLWEAQTGLHLNSLPAHPGGIRQAVWSPDGARLASLGCDQRLCVWDASTLGKLAAVQVGNRAEDRVQAVVWSLDGCIRAAGSDEGSASLWCPAECQVVSRGSDVQRQAAARGTRA